MDEILTGGCLCGDVRYRITAAPVEALYCHCRMCQRAHGAPVIAWLTVPVTAFEALLHLWTESQIGWFEIADHLPRYPTNQRPRPVF